MVLLPMSTGKQLALRLRLWKKYMYVCMSIVSGWKLARVSVLERVPDGPFSRGPYFGSYTANLG
jgi:hypothetical protein